MGALAGRYGTPVHWVRLVCGDVVEHRRRVQERTADLAGHRLPSWADVAGRAVEDWQEPHRVLDTAAGDPAAVLLARLTAGR